MAQDKSAEIINFSGAVEGAVEPPAGLDSDAAAAAGFSVALQEAGVGAYLRDARVKAKLSLEAVSGATKVKADHLEAIEWMRLDRLPTLPYVIGFVKTYASHLGLDAEAAAAQFKTEAGVAMAASAAPGAAPVAASEPTADGARLGSVFAMLVVALFALWVCYQVLMGTDNSSDLAATPPNVVQPSLSEEAQAPVPADEMMVTEEKIETLTDDAVGNAAMPAAANSGATVEGNAAVEDSPMVEGEDLASETADIADPLAVSAPPPARPLPRRARPATPRVRQSVIMEARLTRSVAPDYPNRCTRGAADMESVTIRFDVNTEGRPANERVLSSTNACFEREALRTVKRWRFNPRTVDGAQALESGKTATLNFKK